MNNALFGWLWMLPGLGLGIYLGRGLRDETWLGGYGSRSRRLLRLAHISCIALGALNVVAGRPAPIASILLGVAAVSMPLVCLGVLWRPTLHPLFAVPVLSLIGGCALAAVGAS